MGKLKIYKKPAREAKVQYTLEIYDADSLSCIAERLHNQYGLNAVPEDAYISVDVVGSNNYCYCYDGPCTCRCSCRAEAYLIWHQPETDESYNERVRLYNKMVEAQAKRQAKKSGERKGKEK